MRKLIAIITIVILLVSVAETMSQGLGKRVVYMPFYDECGYRGPWKLGEEIPIMLGDMLGGADEYFHVVPMEKVLETMPVSADPGPLKKFLNLFRNQKKMLKPMTDAEVLSVARQLGGDVVITGVIEDFNMNRTGGGEPMIGGYKSYTTKVRVEQVRIIRVSDGRPLGTVRGEEVSNTRGLGLELFGKPRQMDLEFLAMDSLDFASKRFLGTMWGMTTIAALNKVNKEIRTVIARPDSNWYRSKKFKVLSVEAGNAIINAGSGDGVNPGDRFTVFASESGVRVGKINVLTVWSEHVARTEILEGKDEIRPDDYIMPEM